MASSNRGKDAPPSFGIFVKTQGNTGRKYLIRRGDDGMYNVVLEVGERPCVFTDLASCADVRDAVAVLRRYSQEAATKFVESESGE